MVGLLALLGLGGTLGRIGLVVARILSWLGIGFATFKLERAGAFDAAAKSITQVTTATGNVVQTTGDLAVKTNRALSGETMLVIGVGVLILLLVRR